MAMTLGAVNQSVGNYNTIDNSTQKITQKPSADSISSKNDSLNSDAYAVNVNSENNVRGRAQSIQNTQNLSSMVKIAEGAANNTINSLSTIQKHLTSAVNDTSGSINRRELQMQINNIVAQIDANAYAQYNGVNFQIGDLRAQTLGLTDSQGNVTINVSNPRASSDSLQIVDSAITQLGEILDSTHLMQDYVIRGFSFDGTFDKASTQAVQFPQIDFSQANYMTMEENQRAASSSPADSDISRQIAQLRSEQTQQQLAIAASAMFNQNRAGVLTLLP